MTKMQAPIRILVVDDDRDICEYMETFLQKDGYEVKTIQDPPRAIDEIREGDYHLVILDLMMPKMDGLEVLKRIRQVDDDIAVVIFTGYPSLESAVDTMKFEVIDYLQKPFNPEEFRKVIERVMRKKGLS